VSSADVRDSLAETFDDFNSKSIQHLVHEMGRRLLDGFPAIAELSFEAQNRLWDTAEISKSDERVKIYTDPRPPYGMIGLTLTR
jgi:urate oxidase / 2-oxo-4-hydroxy-4-carboxy-5-ureidoimidazoline decarboxylase